MYSYSGLVDLWFSFYRAVPLPDGDGVDYDYTKFECTCRSPFCRYCCCKHAYAEGSLLPAVLLLDEELMELHTAEVPFVRVVLEFTVSSI